MTLCAEREMSCFIAAIMLACAAKIFVLMGFISHDIKTFDSNQINHRFNVPVLTYLKGLNMLSTCIAILAVDFKVCFLMSIMLY